MASNLIESTPSAYLYPLLIKRLLEPALVYAPEREIVYRDLRRETYRTLCDRVGRLANGLAALGVKPGDVVAVMDWDSHRYLESYFAIPMMGAVILTVNVRLSPEQIVYTLNHARAKVILINADFLPCLAAIKDRLETVQCCVLISDTGASIASAVPLASEYEQMLAANSPVCAFPDFDENTRATTFYTTGTTGLPKGVCFSHRQIVLHTLSLLTAFGLQPAQGRVHRDDVYMPITPMFHVHAWGFPYAATMIGLKQVYPGRYAPDLLLSLKEKEGVTLSHCVPTILQMMLDCPSGKSDDLKGWKIIIGGAALPTTLARAALARGIDVFAGYGMSETCPVLTVSHLKPHLSYEDEAATRSKSGVAVPLVELRIVDDKMKDAPHDGQATGEVVARAPWLTQGYLENPDASEQLWSGGYLHTGDIGNIDPEGYLKITDRMKDVIKSGGEWISSVALEDLILRHPGVAEVAVIGAPDPKWTERPLALIVLKRDCAEPVTAEGIRAHVAGYVDRGAIGKLAVPERVLFVDALERTSVGKLNKKAMREKYCAG